MVMGGESGGMGGEGEGMGGEGMREGGCGIGAAAELASGWVGCCQSCDCLWLWLWLWWDRQRSDPRWTLDADGSDIDRDI